MTPSLAASLPLSSTAPQPARPPEPDKIVECGFCHVSGLSSQMTSIGGGQYRCDLVLSGHECVQRNIRWRETGAKPAPLLSSAELMAAAPLEPLPEPETPVLPPVQEAALERFESAHAAQAAAEAGEDLSEDEDLVSEQDIAIARADALAPWVAAVEQEVLPVADRDVTPDGGENE